MCERSLRDLPLDVLHQHILSLLPLSSIANFRLAAKWAHESCEDEGLWAYLCSAYKGAVGSPQSWGCSTHKALYRHVVHRYAGLFSAPLFLALHGPFGGLLQVKVEPPLLKVFSLVPSRLNELPSTKLVWTVRPVPATAEEQECPVTCMHSVHSLNMHANRGHPATLAWQPTRHPARTVGSVFWQDPWWSWWLHAGVPPSQRNNMGLSDGSSTDSGPTLAVFCCKKSSRPCRHVDEDPLRRWESPGPAEDRPAASPLRVPDVSEEVSQLQHQFFLLNHVTNLFSNGNEHPEFPGLAQALHGAPPPCTGYPPFNMGSAPAPAGTAKSTGLPEYWQEKALMYAPLQPACFTGHPLAGIWAGSYGGHGLESVAVFPVPVSLHLKLWVENASSSMLGGAAAAVASASAAAAMEDGDGEGNGGGGHDGSHDGIHDIGGVGVGHGVNPSDGPGAAGAGPPDQAGVQDHQQQHHQQQHQQGEGAPGTAAGGSGSGYGPNLLGGGAAAVAQQLADAAAMAMAAGVGGAADTDEGSDSSEEDPAQGHPSHQPRPGLEALSDILAGHGHRTCKILRGVKLLGDTNVPAGHVTFEVSVDEHASASQVRHGGVRWELGQPFRLPPGYRSIVNLGPTGQQPQAEGCRTGQLIVRSVHKGRGQIAGTGYKQPKWSKLDLLEFDLRDQQGDVADVQGAAFGLCWHELSSFSLFARIRLPFNH